MVCLNQAGVNEPEIEFRVIFREDLEPASLEWFDEGNLKDDVCHFGNMRNRRLCECLKSINVLGRNMGLPQELEDLFFLFD